MYMCIYVYVHVYTCTFFHVNYTMHKHVRVHAQLTIAFIPNCLYIKPFLK